jgi:hypothetical protein
MTAGVTTAPVEVAGMPAVPAAMAASAMLDRPLKAKAGARRRRARSSIMIRSVSRAEQAILSWKLIKCGICPCLSYV